jgi:hypothetical protein
MNKELFCPIRGLRVLSPPEWKNVKAGVSFSTDFSVVGNAVIYSRPVGPAVDAVFG